MYNLNNNILGLIKLPIFQEEEKDNINLKWSIKLNGLFIGSINTEITDKYIIEKENETKIIYNINRKHNKGLIIDESAYIETIYNSIYVTKEAMLFLIANYFKGKEKICIRQDNKDENDGEADDDALNRFRNEANHTLRLPRDDDGED